MRIFDVVSSALFMNAINLPASGPSLIKYCRMLIGSVISLAENEMLALNVSASSCGVAKPLPLEAVFVEVGELGWRFAATFC